MKIPNKIKIGVHEYKVGSLTEMEAQRNLGKSWIKSNEIKLDHTLPQTRIEETFLHEIVHMILDGADFREESENEKLVSCIANGIHQVIKDNKILRD